MYSLKSFVNRCFVSIGVFSFLLTVCYSERIAKESELVRQKRDLFAGIGIAQANKPSPHEEVGLGSQGWAHPEEEDNFWDLDLYQYYEGYGGDKFSDVYYHDPTVYQKVWKNWPDRRRGVTREEERTEGAAGWPGARGGAPGGRGARTEQAKRKVPVRVAGWYRALREASLRAAEKRTRRGNLGDSEGLWTGGAGPFGKRAYE